MSEDRCLVCGSIIPEGRHVCPNCSVQYISSDGSSTLEIKPLTNLEFLRTKSESEIIDMLSHFFSCPLFGVDFDKCSDVKEGCFADCWHDWLHSEATERNCASCNF